MCFLRLNITKLTSGITPDGIGLRTQEEIKPGANYYIEVLKKPGSPYVLNDNRQQDDSWLG